MCFSSSASNPVWGQSHLNLFAPKEQLLPTILGLHLQILLSSMRVCLGKDVRIKHQVPFLRVRKRRLCIYFQLFVPTGLQYISPESHSGVSTGTFNSEPGHPLWEGGVGLGLGRPLKPRVSSGFLSSRRKQFFHLPNELKFSLHL